MSAADLRGDAATRRPRRTRQGPTRRPPGHETDEKLERGRALVRVSSVVAITVPATWNTHDHGRRLDSTIRLCGFTPLPLDGAHDAAFAAATIPLGTGLPRTPMRSPRPGRPRSTARSVQSLISDFGNPLPLAGTASDTTWSAKSSRADKPFPRSAPPRGARRAGHGWSPTPPPLAGYQMTSEQTPVLWPLIAGDGLPPWGAEMGYDVLSGGKFYCDPMGWVTRRLRSRSPTPTSSSSASRDAASPHRSRRSCSG